MHKCIVFKNFTLSNHLHTLKYNLNYSYVFRSYWTIFREYVVPEPKLPLIIYYCVSLWFCGSMLVCDVRLCPCYAVGVCPALEGLVPSLSAQDKHQQHNTDIT
jgi:hypothetical protein